MTSPQNNANNTPKMKNKGKKAIIIAVSCLMAVVLVIVSAFAVIWYKGKNSMLHSKVNLNISNGIQAIINQDNTVIYKGKVYKYNENIASILCMGIDEEKDMPTGTVVRGNSGQADAIYLLTVDTKTGKTCVLGIPRDTMVDVDLYSATGSYIGVENTQICLSFAYGDGKDKSCENTAKSVTRLLYGMPVDSYFSINRKAVSKLHNAVGPITVIPNETVYGSTISFRKGVPYTITGSNVFHYLQQRNEKDANASYLRMERQLDYLKKYAQAVALKTKDNLLFPVELYNKVSKNSVTNLDVNKITYLATSVINNKNSAAFEFISLKGEIKEGDDGYAEFFADEENLFEIVLSLYYNEVN